MLTHSPASYCDAGFVFLFSGAGLLFVFLINQLFVKPLFWFPLPAGQRTTAGSMEAEKPVFLQSRLLSATTSRFPPDHLESYYITQGTSIFPRKWQLCQNLSISELSQKPAENCIAFCCLRNTLSNPHLYTLTPMNYYGSSMIHD